MAPKEISLLLQNLNKFEVRYLLIGGFAIAFYGSPRATGDIDLWIENTADNMVRLKDARISIGLSEASALQKTTPLVAGFSVFNFLPSDFKDTDFSACYARATDSEYNGIPIKVLEARDLLKEKSKANRLKKTWWISTF